MASTREKEPGLISPNALRKSIGWTGILLPAFLIVGNWIFSECDIIASSISHYYYTRTGPWLVGALFAVGMFLVSYKGYGKDYIASGIAGIAAVFIAMFPTNAETMVPAESNLVDVCKLFELKEHKLRNAIHYGSAAVFFLTLAYMSIFLFTKYDKVDGKTREKKIRNGIFRTCGIIILVAVVLIGLYGLLRDEMRGLARYKPVFWLEWVALFAFGISWLVKGEIMLRDYSIYKNQPRRGGSSNSNK
ncbi:MAG TPA: hypothetical protein VGB46_07505 [Flavisolibacter sp.]|jgi:hypothetical protein